MVPLLASRWGDVERPPASGRYRLQLDTEQGRRLAVTVTGKLPAGAAAVPRSAASPSTTDGGGLVVEFSAPLTDRELGPARQAELEAAYRAAEYQPQNAVFFESFYGQSASCNPLAIDRELARVRPDIARYWSVVDASVRVPEGAIAIIEGSEEWWRVRGSARLLVINDWMRKRFRKRPYQKVLQTWHGTMLKRIALNRPEFRPRAAVATLRERARWDILLSENPHSTRIFRSAYAYFGPIWEAGYPRNDVLHAPDGAGLRAKLGIADDVHGAALRPDLAGRPPGTRRPPRRLGLHRGARARLRHAHPRTLPEPASRPRPARGRGVLDVTSYPDVSELFLVADALITDYSSVMFDFTVTGKPLFFFVPDLENYRGAPARLLLRPDRSRTRAGRAHLG